jgi:hypothetical protein
MEPTESAYGDDVDVLCGRHLFKFIQIQMIADTNLHPMRSAVGGWHRTADGEKQHVILDNYFDEGDRHWKIMGVEITNFHRSLSTYIHGFLDAGFSIAGIVEPTATETQLTLYPELDDEVRVPNFIIYILRKP